MTVPKRRLRNQSSPSISPTNGKSSTLVERILNRLRNHPVVAVGIVFAGVITGLATFTKDVQDILKIFIGEKPTLEQVARDLGASSMESRIVAATNIGKIAPSDERGADNVVRVLEAFINRRAASSAVSRRGEQLEDVIAAFVSLSTILKAADNRSFNTHKPQFSGLTLADLDLSGVYLRGTTFSNTSFDDAVLDRADLSMALFVDVQFSRVRGRNIRLTSAHIRGSCLEEAMFENATLDSIEVSSSDFNAATMKDSNLRGARFENTRLAGASFDGANLANADLRSGLELIDRQLRAAKSLDGAKLPNPRYIKSRLSICNTD